MSFLGKKNQPKIEIEKDQMDVFLELGTLLIYMICVAYLVMIYGDLPDKIPSHMNAKGEMDGYASPTFLWVFLGIGIATSVMLHTLTRIPHNFNYMVTINEKNAEAQYKIGVQMMRFMNFSTAIIWLTILLVFTGVASPQWYTPQTWMIYVTVAFMLLGMGFYIKLSLDNK